MGFSQSATRPIFFKSENTLYINPYNINYIKENDFNENLEQLLICESNPTFLPKSLEKLKLFSYNNGNLKKISDNLIELLENSIIETLDFSDNKLTNVPSTLLKIPTLKIISLRNNCLREIVVKKVHFTTLDLSFNVIKTIPNISPKLRYLHLDGNQIVTVNNFKNTLTSLTLSKNMIKNLSDDLLMEALMDLDLSFNEIEKLDNLDRIAPNLKTLDLSHNKLSSLDSLPRGLKELEIRNNMFSELSFLKKLENLLFLDVSFNNIKTIEDLPGTMILFIGIHNEISCFKSGSPSLEVFNIQNNKLEEMPHVTYHRNSTFSCSHNLIKHVNINLINDVVSNLDLSNNNLDQIPRELFSKTKLRFLNLSFNNLKSIPESLFKSKLITLNVSFNKLESLPLLPKSLEVLIVNSCNLNELNCYSDENEELIEIIAHNNNLSNITILDTLKKVILSKNKFKEFPCFNRSIEYIDISFNEIQVIPTIDDMPNIKYLNISFNRFDTLTLRSDNLSILKASMFQNKNIIINKDNFNNLIYKELFCGDDDKIEATDTQELSLPVSNFFSLIKGNNKHSEDCVITKNTVSTKYSALIDSSFGYDKSSTYREEFLNFITKQVFSSGKKFHNYVLSMVKSKETSELPPSFIFTFCTKKMLDIIYYGKVRVYVLKNDRSIRISVGHTLSYNVIRENLVEMYDSIVRRTDKIITFKQISIEASDKYLVIINEGALKVVSDDIITNCFGDSDSAAEISNKISHALYAQNQTDNISVITQLL